MSELTPGTVPAQPVSNPPMRKGFPLVLALVAVVVIIGVANVGNLISSKSTSAPKSAFATRPATISPQQVKSYQNMQATETSRDAETRGTQVGGQSQQAPVFQSAEIPGPEADAAAPMTAAQRQAIYGENSPNAPQHTSGASQAHAEAKQRELARAKEHQDALNSDTVAIDFGKPTTAASGEGVEQASAHQPAEETEQTSPASPHTQLISDERASKADPMAAYGFDAYQGQLYRVFEGTLLEGVVTNHIDGGFNGPILVMLTTDYYSHDHQQLLMPQGTRLIGTVQSVGSQGQRKLMVTFHRAVCPDGFSLDFDKYIGLDPIGTTGLASHVDSHILSSFAAAAAIGGLGGLAQIGNSASILNPSSQVRDGISSQTSQEAEQILNHFLNRLPVITLKEGSRARVYIGRDILIPSYAQHHVDPTL